KSKPMATPLTASLPTRMRVMKSSAESEASARSNVSTSAPLSPLAASRRSLVVSSVSRNSGTSGRRKRRGGGAEGGAGRGAAGGVRGGGRRADHGAMAAVHAVEIADRDYAALERSNGCRIVANDAERPRRTRRIVVVEWLRQGGRPCRPAALEVKQAAAAPRPRPRRRAPGDRRPAPRI